MRTCGESLRAVPRLVVTAAAEETAGNIRRVNELEGLVHCPVPGCTAPHYADFAVARHCEEPEVESYLEGRRMLAVARAEASAFDQAQGVLRAAVRGLEIEGGGRGGGIRATALCFFIYSNTSVRFVCFREEFSLMYCFAQHAHQAVMMAPFLRDGGGTGAPQARGRGAGRSAARSHRPRGDEAPPRLARSFPTRGSVVAAVSGP